MDLDSLALVLVLVYLTECLVLVRRGALLCMRSWQGWTVVGSDCGMTTAQGAWRLLSVIPSFPTAYQCSLWPFSASETHLASWTALSTEWAARPVQTARIISWKEIEVIEYERRRVSINGAVWFEVRSDQEAVILAERLTRLKAAEEGARKVLLELWMKQSIDQEKLGQRRELVMAEVRVLRIPSLMLMIYVVMVGPWLIHRFGLSVVGWGLLGGLYVQSMVVAWLLYRGHRRLYPRLGDERWARVFSVALSPVSAMRAPDMVGRHGLEEFHPWVVIRSLCSEAVWRHWGGRVARDHLFPRLPEHPEAPDLLAEVERGMRADWIRILKKELKEAGVTWDELVQEPLRTEEVHRAYCPRCHAQFVDVGALCVECGGRKPLVWGGKGEGGPV